MKGLIFTYVMTYGGAVASLFKPYYGLLIYVCFAIIRPESLWYWAVPQGNYSRTIALALFAGWGINGFGSWRLGRAGIVVGLLVAFWIWLILSSLQAAQSDVSLAWMESFTKVVIPFLVGITLIDTVAKLKQLAWVIVMSHAYVAYDLNMAYYSGFNRLQELGFGFMDNNCVAITMVTSSGLGFFLGLNAPRGWQKAIVFTGVALMVHCVLFAFSRGGMLGLIITALMSFLLIPKTSKHYFIFALMILLTLRLAGPQVVERFSSTFTDEKQRDESAQSRVVMWKACLEMMGEAPIFGLGPCHVPLNIDRFTHYGRGKEAHTLWLTIGAEAGVVGLLLLASFYGVCVLRLWPLTRESCPVADPWFRDNARMVVAAIIGFAVSAQFVSVVGVEIPYYIVLLGAGGLKLSSVPGLALANNPAQAAPPLQLHYAQWGKAVQ
jgi:probable O-glycosylation ligase (exosortase A-associated)